MSRNDQIDIHVTLSMYQVHLLLKALRSLDAKYPSDVRDIRNLCAALERNFSDGDALHGANSHTP